MFGRWKNKYKLSCMLNFTWNRTYLWRHHIKFGSKTCCGIHSTILYNAHTYINGELFLSTIAVTEADPSDRKDWFASNFDNAVAVDNWDLGFQEETRLYIFFYYSGTSVFLREPILRRCTLDTMQRLLAHILSCWLHHINSINRT